jgi:hypothetical protein
MTEAQSKPDAAEYHIPANQKWPHSGPQFNAWEDDVFALVAEMQKLKDEPWWGMDSQLKYLSVWIDTRDGGFILKDRDHNRISPDRVVKAMDAWRRFVDPAIRRTGDTE